MKSRQLICVFMFGCVCITPVFGDDSQRGGGGASHQKHDQAIQKMKDRNGDGHIGPHEKERAEEMRRHQNRDGNQGTGNSRPAKNTGHNPGSGPPNRSGPSGRLTGGHNNEKSGASAGGVPEHGKGASGHGAGPGGGGKAAGGGRGAR